MNRRELFKSLGLTLGGIALEQAIPLNRVWSFPSKIVVSAPQIKLISPWRPAGISAGTNFLTMEWVSLQALGKLNRNIELAEFTQSHWAERIPAWPVAD